MGSKNAKSIAKRKKRSKQIRFGFVSGFCYVLNVAILGSVLYKEVSNSNINYVLKYTSPKYYEIKDIDFDDYKNFFVEVDKSIALNEYYTEEEAYILENGCMDFLRDWIYLYTEKEKEDLVFGLRTFQIMRDQELIGCEGEYYKGLTKIAKGCNHPLITTHEIIHGMLKHSMRLKSILNFGFGNSLEEAITETLNLHYFLNYCDNADEYNPSYDLQRNELTKISLLINDNEAIMNSQINGYNTIYDLIVSSSDSIDKDDAIEYITLLDEEKKNSDMSKHSRDIIIEEIHDLYNKMFKDKYGYKMPEDLIILTNDFLAPTIKVTKEGWSYNIEIPREIFGSVLKNVMDNSNENVLVKKSY